MPQVRGPVHHRVLRVPPHVALKFGGVGFFFGGGVERVLQPLHLVLVLAVIVSVALGEDVARAVDGRQRLQLRLLEGLGGRLLLLLLVEVGDLRLLHRRDHRLEVIVEVVNIRGDVDGVVVEEALPHPLLSHPRRLLQHGEGLGDEVTRGSVLACNRTHLANGLLERGHLLLRRRILGGVEGGGGLKERREFSVDGRERRQHKRLHSGGLELLEGLGAISLGLLLLVHVRNLRALDFGDDASEVVVEILDVRGDVHRVEVQQ
mmetsp:Transcript_3575/g.7220  ORF Transcript_3575/g.7220 Transcript_3575/m.7220 type:complete len:262 (-) Transcript_3575:588-1373(-)